MKDPHERMNAIEINDLIADAIANAAERRNQATDLSEEESAQIEGGALCPPLIMGRIICPPIPVGLIYLPRPPIFRL